MLQDKEMVNDALSSMKSGLTAYETAITECCNTQLRSTLQQIRNSDENSQYELFKLAESKGFYKPAQMVNDTDVQQVKSQFQG
jgi:spore coat protein CotF